MGEPLGEAEKNKEMKVKMCGLSPYLVSQDGVITKFVSANQHFTPTFSMQRFKFLRRDCKLSCSSVPSSQNPAEKLLAGNLRL